MRKITRESKFANFLEELNLYIYLERKRQEVCPDLLELSGGNAVVAPVVQVLDVADLGVLVVGHHLASVPASLTGGNTHRVQLYRQGDLGVTNVNMI